MSKFFSRDIAHAIENFLHDDNWNFRFEEEEGLFRFGSMMGGGMKHLDLLIDVKRDEFLTHAIAPLGVDTGDPQMMARMAEFITRANCGLKNGCFEMDYEDGELRFRSYVDCDHQMPSAEVIKSSIYVPIAMFKRYGPGMLEIIFLGAGAEETIEKCERDLRRALRLAPSGDAGDAQGGDAGDDQDDDAGDDQDDDADDDQGDDARDGQDGGAWEDQDGDACDGQDSEVDAMFARLATRLGS